VLSSIRTEIGGFILTMLSSNFFRISFDICSIISVHVTLLCKTLLTAAHSISANQ
jgi:hypothetical protein